MKILEKKNLIKDNNYSLKELKKLFKLKTTDIPII